MKGHHSSLKKIPLTTREKRRQAFKLSGLFALALLLLWTLHFTGILPGLLSHPEERSPESLEQEAATIAEAGVREFTSISLEKGEETWRTNVCSVSTQRFCDLVSSGLGALVWQETRESGSGIVNLSTRAVTKVVANPSAENESQFWRIRYELASASGETVHEAVVSVVREGEDWEFNGFSFIPQDPISSTPSPSWGLRSE